MKDFVFSNPVRAVFGSSCLDELGAFVEGKRAMLVSGAASAKASGSYDAVAAVLKQHAVSHLDYDGIKVCTYDAIRKGTALAVGNDVECVIGLGGAACMDTAKAIAFCARHADDMDAYLTHELEQRNDEKLPLALIPTYPSTGSEANGVSDIMGYAGGIKGVYADLALLYAPFTYSLDAKATTYGLMVMLAQTGYRYFTDRNPISRGFTLSSLKAIIAAHEALMERPEDQDARGTMLWASFVETSSLLGLGIEGSWTYSIFSANGLLRFTVGTSYREGLSVMFPRWLIWAYAHHPEDVRAFVVEVLGGDGNATDDELKRYAYGRLLGILERGGLPTTLDAYGPAPSRQAVAEATNKVSSKEFSVDEYCAMVEACCSTGYPTVDQA